MKSARIRTYLPPLVAIAMAVVSAASLVLLESRANGYRTAQATLSNVSAQSALISVVPADVARQQLLPGAAVTAVRAAKLSVNRQVADLEKQWSLPVLSVLSRRLQANFAAIDGVIRQRAALGGGASGSSPAGVGPPVGSGRPLSGRLPAPGGATPGPGGSPVSASEKAVKLAVQRANGEYERLASTAQTEALAGTFLTIAMLLGAFLFFYGRWVRVLRSTHRDARTDTLTGLGNRRLLIEHLEDALPDATRERPLVLTLYDLDGFKAYNDSLGHLAGDALLTRFARRLEACLGESGAAYRMGGDEFCSLAHVGAEAVEDHLVATCSVLAESGEGYEVDCSAGSVLLPAEASTVRAALSLADQRMYEQKGLVKR